MDLTSLFSAQFENSFKYQKLSNLIKIGAFCFNILLIIVSLFNQKILESTFAVTVVLIVSILSVYFDYDFMKKSIKEHEKGEKLRRIHLADFIFNSKIEDVELEYLLFDIDEDIKIKAKERNKVTIVDSSTNFFNNETDQKSKIIVDIQQNCFETSQYLTIYHKELNRILKTSLIIGSTLTFIVCIYFISSGYSTFSSTQLVIASFNFLFALNIFEYINRYKKKAEQLKTLDQTLHLIKKNVEFSEIIYYFSEYNSILVDKPVYPERVYKDNCEEVENRWKRRI